MKIENNLTSKVIKNIVDKTLEKSANSTSCIVLHQPKAPVALSRFSKIKND